MAEILVSSVGAFGLIFLCILAVLWFVLPFAVFGIKDRMDKQTQLMTKILHELEVANGKHGEQQQPTPAVVYAAEPTHFAQDRPRDTADEEQPLNTANLYADPFAIKFGKKP